MAFAAFLYSPVVSIMRPAGFTLCRQNETSRLRMFAPIRSVKAAISLAPLKQLSLFNYRQQV